MPATASDASQIPRRPRRVASLAVAVLASALLSGCGSNLFGNGFGASGAYPGSSAPLPAETAPRHATLSRTPNERVHYVSKGDTLYNIANRYGVGVAQLKAANGIGPTNAISLGQALKVPGGGASANAGVSSTPNRSFALDPQKAQAAAAALGPQRIRRPVPGEILRGWGEGVGRRKNAGVDLAAQAGDPVGAAADGKVAFVSDPTSPVGAVVLIEHSGGMTTIYGRLTQISVKPGQKVSAGQTIAHIAQRLGDRAALHFEIRYGSEPVNPTPFL